MALWDGKELYSGQLAGPAIYNLDHSNLVL